jgi:hypothetical protein
MITATRSVAVVATRLPNIDRRALSQAWYSALHLAQPGSGTAAARVTPAATAPSLAAAPRREQAGPAAPTAARGALVQIARRSEAAVFTAPADRRGSAGELARRIERAVRRSGVLRPPRASAAVAVAIGGGRVHLLVRSDGATTRIVALCAPHLRERVDRALAHARFALAASGSRLVVAP